MNRFLAFSLAIALAAPTASLAQSDDSDGGFLVSFLEDTLSGDNRQITVTGLTGALSSQATIEKIAVADDEGVWLTLHDAVLDWNRLALLQGRFSVNELSAQQIVVARAPNPTAQDDTIPSPEATGFQIPELPVSVEVGTLSIPNLDLGEKLLGTAASLSVSGNLKIIDGSLDTGLAITRLDRPGDRLNLVAAYSNADRIITLDTTLDEAAGGLLSKSLNLPGHPTLRFAAQGRGPVHDFTANVSLASNGTQRLSGTVALAAADGSAAPTAETASQGTDAAGAQPIRFSADFGGDIDPLLLPIYRPFFGPDMRLTLRGDTGGDSGVTIDSLALQTQGLRVTGAITLAPEGSIETANLQAAVTPLEGQAAILLPVPGASTSVGTTTLRAQKALEGDWTIIAELEKLSHPSGRVEEARIKAAGRRPLDDQETIAGNLSASLSGLLLSDPALNTAIGSDLSLVSEVSFDKTNTFTLKNLQLLGGGYSLKGLLGLSGKGSETDIQADLQARFDDLSQLSDLAGRPLKGAFEGQVSGTYTPLSGGFDAIINAATTDLSPGIDQLDTLFEGTTRLGFAGGRKETGIWIDNLNIQGQNLNVQANGQLSSTEGSLSLSARVNTPQKVFPEIQGPLTLTSYVSRDGKQFEGQAKLEGPHSSYARLAGSADLEGAADVLFEATLSELERFIPELPGVVTARGEATRSAGLWTLTARGEAPAGAGATISGTFDEGSGQADISAVGSLHLDGANPFIRPNLITGKADFDLALKGAPSLEALSGRISVPNASLALPTLAQRIDRISGTIDLAQARANIGISAFPRDGGTVRIGGPLALLPPNLADLSIAIDNVVLTDNLSFDSVVNGQLSYAGNLGSNTRLVGRIDIGETNLNLNTAGGTVTSAPIPPIQHVNEPQQVRQTRAKAGLTGTASSNQSSSQTLLDVLISAPDHIFARGRGLRAELGGQIHLRGSVANPAPSGQIDLIRGTFDIFGRRLDLNEGQISLLGDLKPYVQFQSSANTAQGTATLEISGLIDAPEIKVTSEPPRPSEEALALLLFGDSIQNLSPLAVARLAGSALQLSGRGGKTEGKIRKGTGADNVELGVDNLGSGLLGIGGYVSDNVYTDLNVNTRGDSELSINLDLSKSVTVTGTVDSEGETGVGLFFKRDY